MLDYRRDFAIFARAESVRVIGKGSKERQVPLPEAFGRVEALSVAGKGED